MEGWKGTSLEMERSQIEDVKEPDWTWKWDRLAMGMSHIGDWEANWRWKVAFLEKARLDMERNQIENGKQPDWICSQIGRKGARIDVHMERCQIGDEK